MKITGKMQRKKDMFNHLEPANLYHGAFYTRKNCLLSQGILYASYSVILVMIFDSISTLQVYITS